MYLSADLAIVFVQCKLCTYLGAVVPYAVAVSIGAAVVTYADIKLCGTVCKRIRPPLHKCFVISNRMSYLPIYLGCDIVYPTVQGPFSCICIYCRIRLKTACITAERVILFICPYTARTYTESDIFVFQSLAYSLYKQVTVVSAPIIFICKSRIILLKIHIIIYITARIKIIVHMYAVNVIIIDYFKNTVDNELSDFGKRRIIIIVSV